MTPSPPYRPQSALLQLVLFYGKFCERKMTSEEREALVAAYRKEAGNEALRYRATLLVLSALDRPLLAEDSPAAQRIKGHSPVFRNARYEVYRLAAE